MSNTFCFNKQFEYICGDIVDLKLILTCDGDDKELPYYWFYIVDKATKAHVGKISLRIGHNYHSYFNGNVGYEVFDDFRGSNFAFFATKTILQIAKHHNMSKVILTCDYDNYPSIKTIQKLGATQIDEALPPTDYVFYHENIKIHKIFEVLL